MRTSTRGLITPQSAAQIAGMVRVPPAVDLADIVEQHWVVSWNYRGQPPVSQDVLPDPCVNLAVEPSGVLVYGVATGRSTRVLAGAGTVVGTKFQPGGFSGFVPGPVRALNDRVLTLRELFGPDADLLELELAAASTAEHVIRLISGFVRARRPPHDPRRALVAEVVNAMRRAPAGTRVSEIASEFGVTPRTLQRLFAAHVGAGPKRVLQRFRHQQATDRLSGQERMNRAGLARLAAELGYFDQAHFIHDFRAATGRLPTAVEHSSD